MVLCCLAVFSFAVHAQFAAGIQATGVLASADIKSMDIDFKKNMRALPGAGLMLQYDLGKHIALRSGAGWQKQGSQMEWTGSNEEAALATTMDYIQVPLHLLVATKPGSVRLYTGPGVYAGYGINGTMTMRMKPANGGVEVKEEYKAFGSEADGGGGMQREDFGLGAMAGIKFRNLYAQVQYQHGLRNLNDDKQHTYRNTGAQLTLGYLLR